MYRVVVNLLAIVTLLAPLNAAALDISGPAKIQDGDTIDIAGQRIRLYGIDAFESGQRCRDVRGRSQRCGKFATVQLSVLIAGRDVHCSGDEFDRYDRLIARCSVDGRDLGAQMVQAGMAVAFLRYADTYAADEAAARAAKAGFWAGSFDRPADYRAQQWEVATQTSPDGCPIKGNISKHGQIYHTPYSEYYARTRINLARGERWFCSEREALDAGWRAPLN